MEDEGREHSVIGAVDDQEIRERSPKSEATCNLPVEQPTTRTSISGNQNTLCTSTGQSYNFFGPVNLTLQSRSQKGDQQEQQRAIISQNTDGDTSGIDVETQDTESSEDDHANSHSTKCLLRAGKKKRNRFKRIKTSGDSKQTERNDDQPLSSSTIPHAAFQSLKYGISEAITVCKLRRLKAIVSHDMNKQGLSPKKVTKVATSHEFLDLLEKHYLFGPDNLVFIQWCLLELNMKRAYEATSKYAQKREETMDTMPLVLHRSKGKSLGGDVEFRIKGNIAHMHMKNVNEFKEEISQKLNIPRRYINVRAVGIGSIIIVLQMPKLGIGRLKEAVEKKESWLWELKILDIHFEGEKLERVIQEEHGKSIRMFNEASGGSEIGTSRDTSKATQGEGKDNTEKDVQKKNSTHPGKKHHQRSGAWGKGPRRLMKAVANLLPGKDSDSLKTISQPEDSNSDSIWQSDVEFQGFDETNMKPTIMPDDYRHKLQVCLGDSTYSSGYESLQDNDVPPVFFDCDKEGFDDFSEVYNMLMSEECYDSGWYGGTIHRNSNFLNFDSAGSTSSGSLDSDIFKVVSDTQHDRTECLPERLNFLHENTGRSYEAEFDIAMAKQINQSDASSSFTTGSCSLECLTSPSS